MTHPSLVTRRGSDIHLRRSRLGRATGRGGHNSCAPRPRRPIYARSCHRGMSSIGSSSMYTGMSSSISRAIDMALRAERRHRGSERPRGQYDERHHADTLPRERSFSLCSAALYFPSPRPPVRGKCVCVCGWCVVRMWITFFFFLFYSALLTRGVQSYFVITPKNLSLETRDSSDFSRKILYVK